VIASGYIHRPDPATFEVGPTGLAYDARNNILYVASTGDNAVFAVRNAGSEDSVLGRATSSRIALPNFPVHPDVARSRREYTPGAAETLPVQNPKGKYCLYDALQLPAGDSKHRIFGTQIGLFLVRLVFLYLNRFPVLRFLFLFIAGR
jgi:hypothetical protein